MFQLLRWPVVVLLVAGSAAYMYRYEPVASPNSLQAIAVWDRWGHRLCLSSFYEAPGLHCSKEEFNKAISGVSRAPWERGSSPVSPRPNESK